jgi:hypothetical protein
MTTNVFRLAVRPPDCESRALERLTNAIDRVGRNEPQ